MVISNEEKAFILILHFDEIPDSTEVISQVQIACWPYATYYFIHVCEITKKK